MPIYEYLCEGCGGMFEKLVRRSAPQVSCPTCGGEKLEQQWSTFAAATSSPATANSAPCAPTPVGGCGSGMCGMPGVCGRN